MNFVTPVAASMRAIEERRAWIEAASGVAHGLDKRLGPPDVGDHLPGLGELSGWGISLATPDRNVTGAIFTGFLPRPESVLVKLSASCSGDRMTLTSLEALSALPAKCFDRLTVLSLVSGGVATRVMDRGELVCETRSAPAAALCRRLVEHLVSNASVAEELANAQHRPTLYVLPEFGHVSRPTFGDDPKTPGWQAVRDWEG